MNRDLRCGIAAACGLVALASPPALGQEKFKVVVDLVNLRSDKGKVGCELFASADGYPTEPEKAVRRMFVEIKDAKAVCEFDDVPGGDYAVAVFHDENGNGKLDLGFLGIPKEGTGASRDAKGNFGPPHFSDAHFLVSGATGLTVHMAY